MICGTNQVSGTPQTKLLSSRPLHSPIGIATSSFASSRVVVFKAGEQLCSVMWLTILCLVECNWIVSQEGLWDLSEFLEQMRGYRVPPFPQTSSCPLELFTTSLPLYTTRCKTHSGNTHPVASSCLCSGRLGLIQQGEVASPSSKEQRPFSQLSCCYSHLWHQMCGFPRPFLISTNSDINWVSHNSILTLTIQS